MKMVAAVIGVALVAVYAVGSGLWVNTGDGWYRQLNAPSWQPPDWVFGVIWPYNFLVLAIAAVFVAQRATSLSRIIYLVIFALSIACALMWAYQFYVPHHLVTASWALACAAALTIPLVIIVFKVSVPLGIALLPYQIWVILAANLSAAYARVN